MRPAQTSRILFTASFVFTFTFAGISASAALQAGAKSASALGPNIKVGNAQVLGGSGCLKGGARAEFMPADNDSEIRFTYKAFKVKVAKASGPKARLRQRSCELDVPIQVPAGYRLRISRAEFRHKVNLPRGAQEKLTVLARRSDDPGAKAYSRTITAQDRPEDTLVKKFMSDLFTSACGENFHLRVDSSVRMTNSNHFRAGVGTFASKDLAEYRGPGVAATDGAAMVLKAELEPCIGSTAEAKPGSAGPR